MLKSCLSTGGTYQAAREQSFLEIDKGQMANFWPRSFFLYQKHTITHVHMLISTHTELLTYENASLWSPASDLQLPIYFGNKQNIQYMSLAEIYLMLMSWCQLWNHTMWVFAQRMLLLLLHTSLVRNGIETSLTIFTSCVSIHCISFHLPSSHCCHLLSCCSLVWTLTALKNEDSSSTVIQVQINVGVLYPF